MENPGIGNNQFLPNCDGSSRLEAVGPVDGIFRHVIHLGKTPHRLEGPHFMNGFPGIERPLNTMRAGWGNTGQAIIPAP